MLSVYLNSQFSLMQNLDFVIRILVACLCGFVLGVERSRRFKEAGVRTHMIVCAGAALIMIVSKYGFADLTSASKEMYNGTRGADPARLAAQVVSEGSAGRAIECCELRIADDGEVMIRGENVMMGYYHDEAATAEALHDGWYASGDIGYLDEDGFLFLTGRKKNLIILSDGENVSPEKLEAGIERIEGVSEAMVYEDNGSISVMIYPDEEHMNRQEWFDEQIKHFNDTLPPTQRIKTVRLRSDEFPKSTSKKILRHEVRKELDHV